MSSELIAQLEKLNFKAVHDILTNVQEGLDRGYCTEEMDEWSDEEWKASIKGMQIVGILIEIVNEKVDELGLSFKASKKNFEEHQPLTEALKRAFDNLELKFEALKRRVDELELEMRARTEELKQMLSDMANGKMQ